MSPSVAALDTAQGHSDGLDKKVQTVAKDADQERLILNTIRTLAADLCQQFKGGHPGTVMGAAAIGLALWKYEMSYNPSNPEWFARDRFVLSAGHACLLQYLYLHFTGYSAWTMDQIRQYHAPVQSGSMAAGHPEIEYPGVEVTTGPLGQGIANAVGLAVAGKHVAGTYNKPGYDLVPGKVFAFTGDGCLQEGVGQEAISLAGHLGLDNLILIYDNNRITVDGSIDNCFTDDTSAKLAAQNWHVIEVEDGSNDIPAIVNAFEKAKSLKGKPILINIRTIIGIGSQNQNTGKVHGAALGPDDVRQVKQQLGFDPDADFHVPETIYEYFKDCKPKGQKKEDEWNAMLAKYANEYPEEYKELKMRMSGKFAEGDEWKDLLPTKADLPQAAQPTRKSSGIVVQALVPKYKSFLAGSADLLESTFVNFKGQVEFQKPDSGLGDYSGRQIRYGIREFAMVAIGNGMAAYQKGMIIPIMSTFFMFWLYAAPAARMSSLQKLRFVGIATHDSIGIGEDGPTHQPIALGSFYRSMPNFNLLRPADAEETMGAWIDALEREDTPSLLTLSRQAVPMLEGTDRTQVPKGAYIVYGKDITKPDLTIISTGAEVYRAIEVAKNLQKKGIQVKIASMPSMRYFDAQSAEYKQSILPTKTSPVIAIEAWGSFGWARYAHASLSMHTFGYSAPSETLYDKFGFSVDNMTSRIDGWLSQKKEQGLPGVGEFEELLLGHASGH